MASTAARDDLVDQVSHLYGLQPTKAELIRQSVNDTYRVHVADMDLFLRLYAPNPYYGTTHEDFRFELDLLVHLAAHRVPVVAPIRDRHGELLSEVEVSGQRRYAALFPEATGAPHKAWWPRIDDEAAVRELGRLLARMHRVADDFGSRGSRYEFDLRYLLDEPLRLLHMRLDAHARADDMAFFHDTAEALRSVIAGLGKRANTYGVIHGDAHVGNVLYHKKAGFTLIDFDHCAHGWRVYDLVPLLNTLRINVRDAAIVERVWSLVLEGYEMERPLSELERESIPVFQVLWRLWDMGEMLILSSIWGGPVHEAGAPATQEAHLERALRTLGQISALKQTLLADQDSNLRRG